MMLCYYFVVIDAISVMFFTGGWRAGRPYLSTVKDLYTDMC